jgi:hypothetical protein
VIANYIPIDQVSSKNSEVFSSIMELFRDESLDEDLMIPLVDNLFDFLSDIGHIN